jgi:predicted SnoaL-like aldol condensation-catalyzing enzyme
MTALTSSKDLVLNAYQRLAARDFDGLGSLLHEEFNSHNPDIPAGRTAAMEYLVDSPIADTKVDIQHVIADGNLVAVHYHAHTPGAPKSRSIVDIWRVEDDRLAEHWDVIAS